MLPDHSQALGRTDKALNAILMTNKELAEAPALHMNGRNWAEQIAAASGTERQADREALDRVCLGFDGITRALTAPFPAAGGADAQLM
jgi:hypothetical protein